MYSIHTSIKSEDVRLILSFDFQHPDVKDVCTIQAKIFSHLPLILNTNGVTKLFCVILNLTYLSMYGNSVFLLAVRARQSI